MFLLLVLFHARPMSYKALVLAFYNLTLLIKSGGGGDTRGDILTSS